MNIGFKSIHPVSAFAFFLFAFFLSMSASHPILLVLTFLCGFAYDIKLNGKKNALFFLKFVLPMILLITLFNAVFSHYGVTVLFVMKNGNNFTLEALVFGLVFAIRAASALLWLNCFNEIITSDKLIFLFGRVFPRFALVVSMALRFIPLIRSQSQEIKKAEKGIGNLPTGNGFIRKIYHGTKSLSILISWSLEKGVDTSNSMRARGYGASARTSYNSYSFSVKDIIFLILSAVSFTGVFFVNAELKSIYNPVIDIPMPDVLSAVMIGLFAAVLLMPALYDLKEDRKWSISKLKT